MNLEQLLVLDVLLVKDARFEVVDGGQQSCKIPGGG